MKNSAPARLLIVDDDPGVIESYRHVLQALDASVEVSDLHSLECELFGKPATLNLKPAWRIDYVTQGEDAIHAFKKAQSANDSYVAVFLDIRMPPGIDGYDTAAAIRALDPNVHLIFVSGYSDFAEEDLVEIAGPSDRMTMLPKPVYPDELRDVAARVCKAAA